MSTSTERPHVAVFAFPFGTHAAPLLTLVQRLAVAEPNTIFSFFSTTQSNQKTFSRTKFGKNIKPYNVFDGVPEGHVFSGHPLEAVGLYLKETPNNYKKRLAEVVEDTGMEISCLLSDAFLWFSAKMAEEMGVPWVAFWTAGPTSILVHLYTDVIRSNLELNGKGELVDQSLNFLPGMSAIYFSDLPAELTGNLDEPFSHLLYKMGSMVPHAKAVVLNSYEELDPICVDDLQSKVQMLLNVGLFTLASPPPSYFDENGCISWLDKREASSVAYLSFGTILTPPPPELLALAEALEEKGVSFLWSLRDPTQHSLLEGFLERTSPLGKIVPWTPQIEVLKHPSVGVFVTHCGWNSVVESIAGGVPMICRPYFGDQKLNRRLITDVWQIGASVKGDIFTKKGMMGALDDVLSKKNGTKMRENIGVLKEKAMNAVGVNGRSTKNFKTLLKVVTGCEDAQ